MDKHKDLLPWYINNTLSDNEELFVNRWIQEDPEAECLYQNVQLISQTILEQENQTPSLLVKNRVRTISQNQHHQPITTPNLWTLASLLMLFIFMFMWLVIQPGTQLEWSINGDAPAEFRILRAPAGSSNYEIIHEFATESSRQIYHFADFLVIPGRSYQYRIEVRDQNGNTDQSQVIIGNPQMILASQLSILLTSIILAFGIIILAREIKIPWGLSVTT